MEVKLEPCPHCGGKAEIDEGSWSWRGKEGPIISAYCTKCPAHSMGISVHPQELFKGNYDEALTREDAIARVAALWNRRTLLTPELIEEAKDNNPFKYNTNNEDGSWEGAFLENAPEVEPIPCPCCGSAAEYGEDMWAEVWCTNKECRHKVEGNEMHGEFGAKLIELWNRRASDGQDNSGRATGDMHRERDTGGAQS